MDYNRFLSLDGKSPKDAYDALYKLDIGQVFRVNGPDYETVMDRIERYKPSDLYFEVFPVNPGTPLYTMYGPDFCVVVRKHLLD